MTTNQFYKETTPLSVYVTNLEEYVKGNLVGEWISLPIEKSNFEDFLKTIGNPEEIAIHDYEDNLGLEKIKIEVERTRDILVVDEPQQKRTYFEPPTVKEIKEYCIERVNN